MRKPFHRKSFGWVGYLLSWNGIRIYVAGDTDQTFENQSIECDIALVPVGGFFTMNVKEAVQLIKCIKPAVAIPTHFGKNIKEQSLFKYYFENAT